MSYVALYLLLEHWEKKDDKKLLIFFLYFTGSSASQVDSNKWKLSSVLITREICASKVEYKVKI